MEVCTDTADTKPFLCCNCPYWKKCFSPRFRPPPLALSSFRVIPHPSFVISHLARAFTRVSRKYTSLNMSTVDMPLDKAELLSVVLEAFLYGKIR
jgi:hypothetical protein